MNFSRSMVAQIVVSALVFFVAIQVFHFLGFGFVLVVLLGVALWYFVFGNGLRAQHTRQRVSAWFSRGRAPRGRRAAPPIPDKPLNVRERDAFDDLVRRFEEPGDGGARR